MKNILRALAISISLLMPSCILDEPEHGVEVIKIEKSLISYYDIDGNGWVCREALIYESGKAKDVKFPIQYEGEIITGTKIQYHCFNITAYYKNGKKILIDWENTKRD